ncbi:MAG: hypothetical protein ACI8UD_002512 [Planctomycetota bacterium]|jgi:hypothetical protein
MIGTNTLSPQRFLAATFLAMLAACSGSSGGGPSNAAPVIVTASFAGSGSSPVAGDTLVLGFSTAVVLVSGALLTDEDFTLSGSATLGAVTTAPAMLSSTTLSITLGAGVTFTPDTTTIVLSDLNDAAGGTTTAPKGGGTAITIGSSDGADPVISNVTVADIDDELNGTGAAGGTLQVPTNGWTIDLTYSDNSAIATSQTVITANVGVSTASGTQPVGTNLRSFFTEVSANNTAAKYLVPTSVGFPATAVTLTCIVVDVSGLSSTPTTYSFTVRAFNDNTQPFETTVNASQVWFLDFSRDEDSYATSSPGGQAQVDVTSGANSVSDFEDLLQITGLTSATPIANVQGASNSNDIVISRIKTEMLADLAAYYSGTPVSFTLTAPAGNFNGNSSVTYASLGFSQISISGASSLSGVLGLAIFDPSNTTQNDNTQTDFPTGGSTARLGVFLHTIIDSGVGQPNSTLFRTTYDAFTPVNGGTPIGDDSQDGDRLLGTVGDSRETELDIAISLLARFVATVTAHECGHSVGLVVDGAMPNGLYGNDSTNFPQSASGHIRNASLFPSGSTNLMSPALNFTLATSPSSAFNTLNLAYLREQVFYGN